MSGLSTRGCLVRQLPVSGGLFGYASGRMADDVLATGWCLQDRCPFSPVIRLLRLRAAAPAMTTSSVSASPARAAAQVWMCSPNRNTPGRLAVSGSRMVNPGWEAASGPAASAC
jgi:hypothetical protein